MKILKKDGTLTKKAYELALHIYESMRDVEELKIHTFEWKRAKGKFSCIDVLDDYKQICDLFHLQYEIGNDAKRGGKEGTYILIKKTKNYFFDFTSDVIFKELMKIVNYNK